MSEEVNAGHDVPIAESIFCDALYNVASENIPKALVDMGVAAEVALTQLLDKIASQKPSSAAAIEYLHRRRKRSDKFHWKLFDVPKDFGLEAAETYLPIGGPANWAATLDELYKFRNATAHTGTSVIYDFTTGKTQTIGDADLARFAFAVEALFDWEQSVLGNLKIQSRKYSWRKFSDRPILSISAAMNSPGLMGTTNWSVADRLK